MCSDIRHIRGIFALQHDTPADWAPVVTRRVGLLGGTFDPPHLGHLVVGDQVADQLELDEVRLVVNNSPWQKEGSRVITDPGRRLKLVSAAVAKAPGLVASDVEIRIGGPSYTIVTLERLRAEEPDVEWSVIVGADVAAELDTWHRADELAATERFVVVNRPGSTGSGTGSSGSVDGPPPGWAHDRIEIPPLDISSTDLRALVAAGRSIRHLTPDPVVQLLEAWRLYRQGP